jgi:hypothetical protein
MNSTQTRECDRLHVADHCRAQRAARQLFCIASLCALIAYRAGGTEVQGAVSGSAIEPKPFSASYQWKWGGITVAVSTLEFAHKDGSIWSYRSRSEPRGIGRLYPMRPTLESTMSIDASGVRPLHFVADDGLSTPARHSDVVFDWSAGHASGVYSGVAVDMALRGDEQDDLSAQIAMLLTLRAGRTPDHLSMIDKNTVRDYVYQRLGEERITTGIGPVDTVIYATHHEGSRRTTRFWCPSSRGYVPVKVQQSNGDNVEWTMEIQSLTGE